MSRMLRRRPSPSMVVAFIALCVALAGTATALPGRARVKKDDIARAAVRSAHIKSRAVQSKHIKSRAVTRSKIARRAVGSTKSARTRSTGRTSSSPLVHGATMRRMPRMRGTPPRSTAASVEKMAFVGGIGSGPATVLSLNGLTLTASCIRRPALERDGRPPASAARSSTPGGATPSPGSYYNEDDCFNVGESFPCRSR